MKFLVRYAVILFPLVAGAQEEKEYNIDLKILKVAETPNVNRSVHDGTWVSQKTAEEVSVVTEEGSAVNVEPAPQPIVDLTVKEEEWVPIVSVKPAKISPFKVKLLTRWKAPHGEMMNTLLKNIEAAEKSGNVSEYYRLVNTYTAWAEQNLRLDAPFNGDQGL